MASNDLVQLSAVELRRMIGAKQLSPVELLDACISQIEAINPAVNAICATDFDGARAQAKRDEGYSVWEGAYISAYAGLQVS